MTVKKWRPKREKELINYWTNWLKDHPPICSPQDYGDMIQDPHRAIETFWNRNKEHFRKCEVSKKDVESAFREVVRKMEIYPYKRRKDMLLSDVHFELGKALSKVTSENIFIPLEELKEEPSLLIDEEEILIDKIDQERERDPEKLRQKGMTIRGISKKTGIPKSTLHNRLKKLKK